MNTPVVCYSMKSGDTRCSLIGYGRESVVAASLRKLKYGPCINNIMKFYHFRPSSSKHISSELVQELSSKAKMKKGPYQFPLHINKMVTYSVYIDHILYISRKHNLDIYHRIPLVYSTILSESPDYFMKATDTLLQKDSNIWSSHSITDLAEILYDDIWSLKKAQFRKKALELLPPDIV